MKVCFARGIERNGIGKATNSVRLGRKIFNAKHVGKRTLRAMKVVGMSEGGFGFPNWKREESFLIHLQARKVGRLQGHEYVCIAPPPCLPLFDSRVVFSRATTLFHPPRVRTMSQHPIVSIDGDVPHPPCLSHPKCINNNRVGQGRTEPTHCSTFGSPTNPLSLRSTEHPLPSLP